MVIYEQIYQIKLLVNIVIFYLEMKDIYQVIVYYEKLLDFEVEISEEVGFEENFFDFWIKEL